MKPSTPKPKHHTRAPSHPAPRPPRDPAQINSDPSKSHPALSPAAQRLVDLAHSRGANSLRDVPRHLWINKPQPVTSASPKNTADSALLQDHLDAQKAETKRLSGHIETLQREKTALQSQLDDLKAGFDSVRITLSEAYPNRGTLTLTARVQGLAKDRDIWKSRALTAENAERLKTRTIPINSPK